MSDTGRKLVVCVLLILQNSFHVLLVSYSRLRPASLYLPSVLVFVGECIKVVANLAIFAVEVGSMHALRTALNVIFIEERNSLWRYAVRALSGSPEREGAFGSALGCGWRAGWGCLRALQRDGMQKCARTEVGSVL